MLDFDPRVRILDPLEFVVRWEAAAQDSLPVPLTFRSGIASLAAYERAKYEVRERIRREPDPQLDETLAGMVRPDVRLVVHARDGREPESAAGCIRMLGARTGDQATLVIQHMGDSIWHSTGFTVRRYDETELAMAIAMALPSVAPGAGDPVEVLWPRTDGMDHSFATYVDPDVYGEQRQSIANRSEQFLSKPASCVGVIEIAKGWSELGPRGLIQRKLRWRDLRDGRYLIADARRPLAVPGDAAELAELIGTACAEVLGLPRYEDPELHYLAATPRSRIDHDW